MDISTDTFGQTEGYPLDPHEYPRLPHEHPRPPHEYPLPLSTFNFSSFIPVCMGACRLRQHHASGSPFDTPLQPPRSKDRQGAIILCRAVGLFEFLKNCARNCARPALRQTGLRQTGIAPEKLRQTGCTRPDCARPDYARVYAPYQPSLGLRKGCQEKHRQDLGVGGSVS